MVNNPNEMKTCGAIKGGGVMKVGHKEVLVTVIWLYYLHAHVL